MTTAHRRNPSDTDVLRNPPTLIQSSLTGDCRRSRVDQQKCTGIIDHESRDLSSAAQLTGEPGAGLVSLQMDHRSNDAQWLTIDMGQPRVNNSYPPITEFILLAQYRDGDSRIPGRAVNWEYRVPGCVVILEIYPLWGSSSLAGTRYFGDWMVHTGSYSRNGVQLTAKFGWSC